MIVTLILLLFVIPQFEALFKGFGADLPAFTRAVIDLSKFVQTQGWWMGALFVGGIVFFLNMKKRSAALRQFIDRLSLKIPIIGPILVKAAIALFPELDPASIRSADIGASPTDEDAQDEASTSSVPPVPDTRVPLTRGQSDAVWHHLASIDDFWEDLGEIEDGAGVVHGVGENMDLGVPPGNEPPVHPDEAIAVVVGLRRHSDILPEGMRLGGAWITNDLPKASV